jgi:hypothetical protein
MGTLHVMGIFGDKRPEQIAKAMAKPAAQAVLVEWVMAGFLRAVGVLRHTAGAICPGVR